eukprot:574241-Prorocentrum_minimum.AAC.1
MRSRDDSPPTRRESLWKRVTKGINSGVESQEKRDVKHDIARGEFDALMGNGETEQRQREEAERLAREERERLEREQREREAEMNQVRLMLLSSHVYDRPACHVRRARSGREVGSLLLTQGEKKGSVFGGCCAHPYRYRHRKRTRNITLAVTGIAAGPVTSPLPLPASQQDP